MNPYPLDVSQIVLVTIFAVLVMSVVVIPAATILMAWLQGRSRGRTL